jgi:hypothetical protein
MKNRPTLSRQECLKWCIPRSADMRNRPWIIGLVLLGLSSVSLAGDRGDRYRYGKTDCGDRGERYRGSARWSVGFGYSSGGWGDRSYISVGYRSGGGSSYYYSYRSYTPVCSPPVYVAPRPIYVERPVYVPPPVVYTPPPVVIQPKIYTPGPVIYHPTPTYYYNSGCAPGFVETRYYYGR